MVIHSGKCLSIMDSHTIKLTYRFQSGTKRKLGVRVESSVEVYLRLLSQKMDRSNAWPSLAQLFATLACAMGTTTPQTMSSADTMTQL